MTDNESKMLELLKNATRAMSKRFPDMKKSQQEINEFLSRCFIPKKTFRELYDRLVYAPLDEAIEAHNKFSESYCFQLLPHSSTEFIDWKDLNYARTILKRRRENINKSVDDLFAEMENAYANVIKEQIPNELREDLVKFKQIMDLKDVVSIVTDGKDMLYDLVTHPKYPIDQIIVFKINGIRFFIRMLEEKSLGYLIKKES